MTRVKLQMFGGHMQNEWQQKNEIVVWCIVERINNVGRPQRVWAANILDWRRADLHLSYCAKRTKFSKKTSDPTNAEPKVYDDDDDNDADVYRL